MAGAGLWSLSPVGAWANPCEAMEALLAHARRRGERLHSSELA